MGTVNDCKGYVKVDDRGRIALGSMVMQLLDVAYGDWIEVNGLGGDRRVILRRASGMNDTGSR